MRLLLLAMPIAWSLHKVYIKLGLEIGYVYESVVFEEFCVLMFCFCGCRGYEGVEGKEVCEDEEAAGGITT